MRYIIVTAASLPNDSDGDEDEVEVGLNILTHEGEVLLFNHRADAEDFMDVADVSEEMVVIDAPESLRGIIVA